LVLQNIHFVQIFRKCNTSIS